MRGIDTQTNILRHHLSLPTNTYHLSASTVCPQLITLLLPFHSIRSRIKCVMTAQLLYFLSGPPDRPNSAFFVDRMFGLEAGRQWNGDIYLAIYFMFMWNHTTWELSQIL